MVNERYVGKPAAIASYDYEELTSGVGYRTFYGCASRDFADAVTYFLTPNTLEAMPLFTSGFINSVPYVEAINKDFDITFQVPSIVAAGDAFVNITLGNDTVATTIYLIANVYHVISPYGAAQETLIGTYTTDEYQGGAVDWWRRGIAHIPMTRKKFAIGDRLRLTIIIMGKDAAAGTFARFKHDPASITTVVDVSGDTRSTNLKFDVPFEVRL